GSSPGVVPFAGSWRQMMDLDGYSEFIGEALQFKFPQSHARAVRSAAIGSDDQAARARIATTADVLPPSADRLNREGRRVVVDPDVDPARVSGQIINSIRHGATELLDQEIVHAHFFRIALFAPLAAGVLEIADQLLLLGIDGYSRLVLGHGCLDRVVDHTKLRVALLACRLNFCFFSNSPTTVWLILCPSLSSSAASRRRLLHVQRRGDIGSPRVSGSTSAFRSSSKPGSVSVNDLRPPPGRRTRLGAGGGASSSFRPRPIVLAAMRVTRETAAMPPRPAALASDAAKSRRCRSSS